MNTSRLKLLTRSLLMLTGFLCVSLLTIWQAFSPLSVSSLRTGQGVIEENGKGLYVHTGDIRHPILKVSPFDDYIYHKDGEKVHIFDNYHFNDSGTVHTLSDAFSFYFHQLTIPTNTFTWTITGPDGTVTYKASLVNNQVTIKRNVIDPEQPITAYGNSVVFCSTCFVTSGNDAYFTGVYSTNQKVFESLSTSFTPVLITDVLPPTAKEVTVRTEKGKAILQEKGESTITYEEPWHLLEVKAKDGTQVIKLEL